MSAINRLLENYARQVRLPWATNLAGKQRVWFAVYPPAEERRLRAKLPQFETHTVEAQHGWSTVNLTRVLPEFLATQKYREQIFEKPQHWRPKAALEERAAEIVTAACASEDADSNSVVAVVGLSSLFDFMRVSSLMERVEDNVRGRLLVFFPGEYTGNVYRFMDARDGFNYLAVPITSAESFIPQ
jgi:hypothetical protein